MTRSLRRQFAPQLLTVALAAALLATTLPMEARQSATGFRPSWGDLETWSRVDSSTRQNEVGLGLQVSGAGGTMFMAFTVKFDVRSPSTPREVFLTAAAPANGNPNQVRPATLSFQVENEKHEKQAIDLNSSLQVDNPSFGTPIESGMARVRAADFLLMAKSTTMSGQIFGVSVSVRPDQIKAIKAYADRIGLKTGDAR